MLVVVRLRESSLGVYAVSGIGMRESNVWKTACPPRRGPGDFWFLPPVAFFLFLEFYKFCGGSPELKGECRIGVCAVSGVGVREGETCV